MKTLLKATGPLGYWCPMPNAQSGIANYGYELLLELHKIVPTTVIFPKTNELSVELPENVSSVTPEDIARGLRNPPQQHLYHIGNHKLFHSWMLAPLRQHHGITILHDLSLFDLYWGLFEGSSSLWNRELELSGYDPELLHVVDVDGISIPDRLHYTFLNNIIPYSLKTVCHSRFGCELISDHFPKAKTFHIPLASKVHTAPDSITSGVWNSDVHSPTFAVIGGISKPKRTHIVLKAFAKILHNHPQAKLILAGRCDDITYLKEIESIVIQNRLTDAVSIRTDVSNDELQHIIHSSRMVITLRWPTAGETSAVIMQALGSGRVAVTSDLPQFREFDEMYVKRIPIGGSDEISALISTFKWAITKPHEAQKAGEHAQSWVEQNATFEHVAEKYAEILFESDSHGTRKFQNKEKVIGINAFGDWTATTGLAHAARRLTSALMSHNVMASPNYVDSHSPHDAKLEPVEFKSITRNNRFPIELNTLNINEFHLANPRSRSRGQQPPYRITTWAWEFPYIPDSLLALLDETDEIWVISSFIQRVFMRYTNKPVHVVPCIVPAHERPTLTTSEMRRKLGLPVERTIFLFSFDYNSTIDRKNPMAVVEAYAAAAADEQFRHENCLVIKSVHAKEPFKSELELALAKIGGIHLDWHLNNSEMTMLYHSIDVYISLHRAEGFGLGMAEAMAVGKPVIATGYSGNLDFMNAGNSLLVGYQLREIDANDFKGNDVAKNLFPQGNFWAEPNINQATQLIQLISSSALLRNKLGKRAHENITNSYCKDYIGRIAYNRLLQIYKEQQHIILDSVNHEQIGLLESMWLM